MNLKSNFGWLGSIVLSTFFLFVFYGPILLNPNSTYLSGSGDGLKSTFGSVYHIKYDTTYLRTDYMNYPFGESVFYTGGQPVITNTFKFLKSVGIDLSDQILGIINIWMLLSVVLGTLIIYLILRELKLPVLYSIVVSTIIAFLSPQIDRFGGHYNLAYLFFIPLMIYLFFLFYKTRKIKYTILLCLLALFALCTHAYFFGFYALIVIVFWAGVLITDKERFGKAGYMSLHIFIQFFLPFILFQVLVLSSGELHDRTSYPWGFFRFVSYFHGIFLPINKSYGSFLHLKQPPWESISYVGLVASVGFFTLIIMSIKRYKKQSSWKSIFRITDNTFLNIIFWASILGLVYSFGVPFTTGFKKLFNYMGPLKQLRAPGRFAWLFYYSLNIVVFYLLWYYQKSKKGIGVKLLLTVALLWGSYDAYLNVKSQKSFLNNKIDSLEDIENSSDVNSWYKEIDFNDYQAIIPLPYFHIGSENYWIGGSAPSKKTAFVASMKTGLPLTAVMMGRTSMSQTVMNMQLLMEPYNSYDIMEYWPNDKPFLVIFVKEGILSIPERNIKNTAKLILSNEELEIREIRRSDFEQLLNENKENVLADFNSLDLFSHNDFLSTDSVNNFFYNGFGDVIPGESEVGENSYTGNIKKKNIILDTQISNIDTSKSYLVSFWIEHMDQDMYPRTELISELYNEQGEKYQRDNFQIRLKTSIIKSNGWGLVEFGVQFKNTTDRIKISLRNDLLTKGNLRIDELLIRPQNTDVFVDMDKIVYKNNRFYIINQ